MKNDHTKEYETWTQRHRHKHRHRPPRLKTNLDTNFLKLIAILCMVVDHVGTVFFPGYPAFRWV